MDYVDYYNVLGIDRSADKDAVTKAYRLLARQYHPDRNGAPEAEEKFRQISEAYEVLTDPEKRAAYDRYGAEWQAARGGVPPTGEYADRDWHAAWGQSGLGTFFEQFFGRRGHRTSGLDDVPVSETLDREAVLELDVLEAHRGGKQHISLRDAHAGRQQTYVVNVPAGIRQGQRIRLPGQGRQGDGLVGDLYLRVQLREDGPFRLRGDDVYAVLDIMPWTAALGGTVRLQTLDGAVDLKVPAGSSSGQRIRLRGRGYATGQRDQRGDFYAEVRIVVPHHISPPQRQLFEQLTELDQQKETSP